MTEIFLKINGYKNYSVSDQGNIRNDTKLKILKQPINRYGYKTVTLRKNGKNKTCTIHKLVADAFLEKIKDKDYVDHIDGIKTNNHLGNLRYVSLSENSMNKSMHNNNTSGMPGVHYAKKDKKWQVRIMYNKKRIQIGNFSDLDDAIRARKIAQDKYFGKYQRFDSLFERLKFDFKELMITFDALMEEINHLNPIF